MLAALQRGQFSKKEASSQDFFEKSFDFGEWQVQMQHFWKRVIDVSLIDKHAEILRISVEQNCGGAPAERFI